VTVPIDRVRIFSRSGTQLTEFRASVARSWAIGQEGAAGCELKTSATYLTEENIQFGNWLLVENNMLPPWVGMIDFPREWSANTVSIYAYSPERIFTYRVGPEEETFSGSAGVIFRKLIELTNEIEPTVILPGYIWRGGDRRREKINPATLDSDFKRIVERSGEEYEFVPRVDNQGTLRIYARWRKRLGDRTEYYLTHGSGGNLELLEQALVEDGPIVNDVIAYGTGATWAEKERGRARNRYSINKYGLRQTVLKDKKTDDPATLENYANRYLQQHRNPVRRLFGSALNKGSTFDFIKLGNVVNMVLKNSGFHGGVTGTETRTRIIGMAYDPDMGHKIDLVLEELVSG